MSDLGGKFGGNSGAPVGGGGESGERGSGGGREIGVCKFRWSLSKEDGVGGGFFFLGARSSGVFCNFFV